MKKQGRGFIWTQEEETKLKEIYTIKQLSELSQVFNRPETAIRAKALKLGINRDQTKKEYNKGWSIEEEQYLINNYFSGDPNNIARQLNRTRKSITERAKVLKIKRDPEIVRANGHKYSINENYFKVWSDEMAYILGLIWTDGCMLDIDYRIQITQHIKDKYILEDVYKVLESNNTPYKSENTYNISICNKIIYEDLKQLGLEPRKSKTVKIPNNLPDQFISAFIRGTMDGDGSVSIKKGMKINTASKDFAEGLCKLLDEINIDYKIYNEQYVWDTNSQSNKLKSEWKEKDIKTDFYAIRILKKSELKKIYDLMYKDAKLFLKRKKQSFMDMGIENEDFLIRKGAKRIEGIDQNNNKIIFNQIKDAKEQFPAIYKALKSGEQHKGYTFKYADQD